jgi:hypothetical protein
LTVGIPTAGRPEAISRSLSRLDATVGVPHELVVFDNTPEYNDEVPYEEHDARVIRRERSVAPGTARQRIAESTETDRLLLLDDDTLVCAGSVERLMDALDRSPCPMASGIWTVDGVPEAGRDVGAILARADRDDDGPVLVRTGVDPGPLLARGVESLQLDTGLPTLMLDTELFDSVGFDPRYDWFYEWMDFFTQTFDRGDSVVVDLRAEFQHAEVPYETPTIRRRHDPQTDRRRFVEKWGMEVTREPSLDWADDDDDPARHIGRRAAAYYADHGALALLRAAVDGLR